MDAKTLNKDQTYTYKVNPSKKITGDINKSEGHTQGNYNLDPSNPDDADWIQAGVNYKVLQGQPGDGEGIIPEIAYFHGCQQCKQPYRWWFLPKHDVQFIEPIKVLSVTPPKQESEEINLKIIPTDKQ